MHPQGQDPLFPFFDPASAFHAYETIRDILPPAMAPVRPQEVPDLGAVADRFDAFVFDAYGVLNLGSDPIPGAVARVAALMATGKTCIVVTNAASLDDAAAIGKFRRLGFSFPDRHIVTSRQAAEETVMAKGGGTGWAVLGLERGEAGVLPFEPLHPDDERAAFDEAEGFLFLSINRWSAARQAMLEASLAARRRPVVIGNPDIIAPQGATLSTEPGYFGYRLKRLGLGDITFVGKPFDSVYALARRRFPSLDGRRVLMLGDTLHTDVLGGAAQGWSTALVTGHGLFRGQDHHSAIRTSRISPDIILPSI